MKKLIAFLLSTAMLVTALAGCGSETASTPDQGEAAVEEAGDAEATTVTGTDKTMIVTNGEACATCDPVGASAIQEQMLQVNVYDSLVFPTFDGEMIPWVAESWDISEDGLQYTFHLRDDVKFHNGDTLKASDVVFSMNRLMTMAISYSFMWADCFDSCEAIDDTTVVFNLKIPFGPFISSLCRLYIVSEAEVMAHLDDADTTYGDMKDYGANWLLSNDAGSGPYMISDYSAENYVVCDKFADYWGGWEEGAPEQMKIVFTKEETTMKTMMKNNELDISAPYQSTEFYESVDAMEGIDVASYDTGMVQYLMYNCQKAPTDDANFRKGLSYLIDYAVTKTLYYDADECTTYYCSNLPGASIVDDLYAYSTEKAQECFDASKYADQLDDVVVDLTFHNATSDNEVLATYIKSQLDAFGIKSEITMVPWLTLVDLVSTPETSPGATSVSVTADYWEAGAMISSRYSSANTGTWMNSEWLCDDELDAMITDALATPDDTERYAKYDEITNYVKDVCPCALIASVYQSAAYHADYVEWPVAQYVQEGKIPACPAGYHYYFHDCKLIAE